MRYAVRWLGTLFAALWFSFALTGGSLAETPTERALAVYEEGKKLYDAENYAGARSKFIEAARTEPDNPRWHYNLGLVHRQLGNIHAARQSLLKARELNPAYKRAEIEQKLLSMGFTPQGATADAPGSDAAPNAAAAASATATDTNPPQPAAGDAEDRGNASNATDTEDSDIAPWLVGGLFVAVWIIFGLAFWLMTRRRRAPASPAPGARSARSSGGKDGKKIEPPPDARAIAALADQLAAPSAQLVQVEHAMRLGENADLRSLLDHATRLESTVRACLDAARSGDAHAFRKAGRTLPELQSAARRALDQARGVHGEPALAGAGEKIACYFCARPLANPDYRRLVAMRQGAAAGELRTDVLACPNCAQAAAQGEAPNVLVGDDGRTHWSELPGFDPYAARHAAVPDAQRVPAWRFAPRRSLGELALLAGGAALAGGALTALLRPEAAQAADAGAPLLDLDAAREAGLAHEAARATAERAGEMRGERFTDHS